MLFDLTNVNHNRVRQVDEIKITSRMWVRQTTFFWFLAGCLIGFPPAMLFARLFGAFAYLITLGFGGLLVMLFVPKRSRQGERQQSRAQRYRDAHHSLDGAFIMPGEHGVFHPNGYRLILQYAYPIATLKPFDLDRNPL